MGRPPASFLKDTHPHLIDEMVNPEEAEGLGTSSEKYINWRCPLGHEYKAKVFNRTSKRPTGCPVCSGKQILVGFNDMATTDPDRAKLCANPNDAHLYSRASNKTIPWCCENGHVWIAKISNVVVLKQGCPYCSGRNAVNPDETIATTHPDIAKELVDQSLALKLKPGSNLEVEWVCPKGHLYKSNTYTRTHNNKGCPFCSGRYAIEGENDLKTTHPHIAAQLVDQSLAVILKAKSDKKVEWRCQINPSHTWFTSVYNRVVHHTNCPICINKVIVPGENDIATTNPELIDLLVDKNDATKVSQGSGKRLLWQCPDNPDHIWERSVYTMAKNDKCPLCQVSNNESELISILEKLIGKSEIKLKDRSILKGNQELDILLPNYKLAIEFNGVWWHCEKVRPDKNYHLNKTKQCNLKGIDLIHIWEDDWWEKKEIIIRMIAHKLNVTHKLKDILPNINNLAIEKVPARKLKPIILSVHQAKDFLEKNHIQGYVLSSYQLGLIDENNMLRAIMSIRSPKNNARMHRPEGVWEIQRYATCGIVQGGFSKLLKFAQKTIINDGHYLDHWVSFSDKAISNGNLYATNGFIIDSILPPSYKYIGTITNWHRTPKEAFQKKTFKNNPDLLFEDGWTEAKAAEENKLYRIWDSGKIRWIKSINP